MKYIKVFNTDSEYQAFKDGDDYVTPNICLINENKTVRLTPIPPPLAGDVAYWDGSKVKTTPLSEWSTSLGTPVGVVVVPKGFAPDGKVRIIGLKAVDRDGNATNSYVKIVWGGYNIDTSLTNYSNVPITNNSGSTSTGYTGNGYLPTDMYTGTPSYVDSKSNYNKTYNLIPSPYLGDEPNPEYYKTILGNNALSDFNGLSNTETWVSSATTYHAAEAAWNYKDGESNLQWYIPAMGELGYLMPRFKEINNTIKALGGVVVGNSGGLWSSSELGSYAVRYLDITNSFAYHERKTQSWYVRPFAIIE